MKPSDPFDPKFLEDVIKVGEENIAAIEKLPDGPFKQAALKDAKACGKMAKTAHLQKARMENFVRGMQKGSSVTGTGNHIAGKDEPTRAKWRDQ